MRKLTVTSFSCLQSAELAIGPLTLLIGPQASGKSVLCKLAYFFGSLLEEQIEAIADLQAYPEYLSSIKERFIRLFPIETWGNKPFRIAFEVGSVSFTLSKGSSKKAATSSLRLLLSEQLKAHYERSLSKMKDAGAGKRDISASADLFLPEWRLQQSFRRSLRTIVGDESISSQLFIPAGRSFFTSIGKAVAAFENSSTLDPSTLMFGRILAARTEYYYRNPSDEKQIIQLLDSSSQKMLGGSIVRDREREFLQTPDGRKIPLGAMSSGQQELFPLLRVLPRTAIKGANRIIYVEEPEAHLFPIAQSQLIQVLSELINLYKATASMVITTHSPYVLAKFNNLIKAGQLAQSRSLRARISPIIPKDAWIAPNQLAAFAICDGKLISITEPDGLINGEYLDDVSNHISNEFSKLVEVEYGS